MPAAWAERLRTRREGDERAGLLRTLVVSRPMGGARSERAGLEVVSFASNDYLGLARDPRVIEAAAAAARRYGASSSASRLVDGNLPIHEELESALSAFKNAPACRVFSSGYLAAVGILGTLCGRGDEILLDRLCHACLIDGAFLSGARVRTFRHNDVADLAEKLRGECAGLRLAVVESLYSMDGDLAPLAEISRVCREAGAMLLVDDAHGTGVIGEDGRGATPAGNKDAWPGHVVLMGTLSKALASQGGYICCGAEIAEAIVRSARTFLFDTGLCPAAAGAAIEAIRIAASEPWRRENLWRNVRAFADAAAENRISVPQSPTQICPIFIGDEKTAVRAASEILRSGFYIPAIRYPTVAKGKARLRVSISAAHAETDVRSAAAVIAEAVATAGKS